MAPRRKTPSANPPPDPAAVPLTATEKRFLDEYLIDENGSRAYRAVHPGVGYGAARMAASRLVAKDNIQAEIRAARQAQQERTQITADAVLTETARIAFSDVVEVFDPKTEALRHPRQIPLAARRAIASIKVSHERTSITRNKKTTKKEYYRVIEMKFWSKPDALEKLIRHLGLTKELPPLEVLLRALPPHLSDKLRKALIESATNGHTTQAPGSD